MRLLRTRSNSTTSNLFFLSDCRSYLQSAPECTFSMDCECACRPYAVDVCSIGFVRHRQRAALLSQAGLAASNKEDELVCFSLNELNGNGTSPSRPQLWSVEHGKTPGSSCRTSLRGCRSWRRQWNGSPSSLYTSNEPLGVPPSRACCSPSATTTPVPGRALRRRCRCCPSSLSSSRCPLASLGAPRRRP